MELWMCFLIGLLIGAAGGYGGSAQSQNICGDAS